MPEGDRPVAVTGLGVVSAHGHGHEAFWAGLHGAARPTRGREGLAVPGLDVRTYAETAIARRIDRTSLLALAACRLALRDAAGAIDGVDPARVGLCLASALGNLGETATFLDQLLARGTGSPLLFPNMVMNAPLSYASIELGVTGPTAFLSEGEAAGESAIAWGVQAVAEDRVDVCVAGAADELDAVLAEVLREAGELAGVDLGEGAAVLVLESMPHAQARGARMYARAVPHPGFGVPAPIHGWPRDPDRLARRLAPIVAGADVVFGAAGGHPGARTIEAAALRPPGSGPCPPVVRVGERVGYFGAVGGLAVAAAALSTRTGEWPVAGDARRAAVPVRVAVVDGLARGGACRPIRLEAVG